MVRHRKRFNYRCKKVFCTLSIKKYVAFMESEFTPYLAIQTRLGAHSIFSKHLFPEISDYILLWYVNTENHREKNIATHFRSWPLFVV